MKITNVVKPILQTLAVLAIGGAWIFSGTNALVAADENHKSVAVTGENFKSVVLDSDKVVLVDFWAEWCGPCLAVAPTLEELAKEHEGKLVVAKVDVDTNRALAQQYGIKAIPNMKIFKGGKLVDELVGAAAKEKIEAKIKPHF